MQQESKATASAPPPPHPDSDVPDDVPGKLNRVYDELAARKPHGDGGGDDQSSAGSEGAKTAGGGCGCGGGDGADAAVCVSTPSGTSSGTWWLSNVTQAMFGGCLCGGGWQVIDEDDDDGAGETFWVPWSSAADPAAADGGGDANSASKVPRPADPPAAKVPRPADPAAAKARREAALARLRGGSTGERETCPLCRAAIFPNERFAYRGVNYHRACMACGACGASLVGEGKVFEGQRTPPSVYTRVCSAALPLARRSPPRAVSRRSPARLVVVYARSGCDEESAKSPHDGTVARATMLLVLSSLRRRAAPPPRSRGGIPFCAPCAARAALRRDGRTPSTGGVDVEGETAKQAGAPKRASHVGDVAGVKDAIGDELEAALGGMVPRCETCGEPFGASDEVLICGMIKYHKECRFGNTAARARTATAGTALSAREAARAAERLVTLKLFLPGGGGITFFFERSEDEKATAKARAKKPGAPAALVAPASEGDASLVVYAPDDAEHAKARRRVALPSASAGGAWGGGGSDGGVVVAIAGCGEFPAVRLEPVRGGDSDVYAAVLQAEKKGLRFAYDARFHVSRADEKGARSNASPLRYHDLTALSVTLQVAPKAK